MVSLFGFQRRKRRPQDEENSGDGAADQGPPPSRGPLAIKPMLQEACVAHAVASNDAWTLEWCREPGERVKIGVGHGGGRQLFLVHKRPLRHHSDYFRRALRPSASRDAGRGQFDFPEADPAAFSRFVRWLYSCRACKKPRTYEAGHRCSPSAAHDPGSWCGPARPLEHDYVLGDWLLSPRYSAFVLSHMVPHVADDDFDLARVLWILDNTAADSPLNRFTRHWVSWLRLRWPDGKGTVDWGAHPALGGLDDGWAATDPRKFRIDHWETRCAPASADALCPHRVVDPPSAVAPREPGRLVAEPPRSKLWENYKGPLAASLGVLILIYHILFPFAWVGVAAYIIVADDDPLLMEASKDYSLVMGCLAVIGILPICLRMMSSMYFAMACSLLVIIACVLSFASSVTCLAGADRAVELDICRMEIGVGVLQFFYAIIVATSYKW